MKVRCDFLTNSSSSSFILARKGGLSNRQKEAIASFVERSFLGERVFDPDNSAQSIEEVIKKYDIYDDETAAEVRRAAAEGYSIYEGEVIFDYSFDIADLYEELWHLLSVNDDSKHAFEILDGDLSY